MRPNSEHAFAKLIVNPCRASSVCAFRAASSANSISLMRTLRTKTCKVEQITIGSGKEVYAIFRLVEGKRQQHREENAEECWGKHTSLFHYALSISISI